MLKLYFPTYEELSFRKELLADEKTMEYNKPWGGTIDFDESKWDEWYSKYSNNNMNKFYSYLVEAETNNPVGEVGFRYDDEFKSHMISIIIHSNYRGKGYGKRGLKLLIDHAFNYYNIPKVQDNIAINSKSSHRLFESLGFKLIKKTNEYYLYELINEK